MDGSDQRGGCLPGPWPQAAARPGWRMGACSRCARSSIPDARIAHRLLSQRMVQHDAILGTLALAAAPPARARPGLVEAVAAPVSAGARMWRAARPPQASPEPAPWPHGMAEAERRSQASGHAELALADLARGRLYLVQAGLPASYALLLDLRSTIPADEWPMPPATSPGARLAGAGRAGIPDPAPAATGSPGWNTWSWEVSKTLASPSQPLVLYLRQPLDASVLPWTAMLGWALVVRWPWPRCAPCCASAWPRRRAEQFAAAGPGGAAQYAGRTGRRHGA